MSAVYIRRALQTALAGMTPALTTVFENESGEPSLPTAAYQKVYILFAEPDNATYGRSYHEVGFMQVDLMYPEGSGPSAAATRAELLRSTFKRGDSFTSNGITVTIQRTPEILPARNEGGRYVQPVRIRFFAHIITA